MPRRRLAAALLGAVCGLFSAGTAWGQSCWTNSASVSFGATGPTANTDTQVAIPYTCQSAANTTYFRLCATVGDGSPISGINPRWMTNYNGAQMAYNLYSDAARTQIIGPPPSGGGYAAYTWTLQVPAGYVQMSNSTQMLYGRVPAQDLPAAYSFGANVNGSMLYWAWSTSGYPATCTGGANTGSKDFYLGLSATVPNHCRISLAGALDFGSASTLASATSQTSSIRVRCPNGTAWQLGLNNGSNATGSTRRMRSAAGNYVSYELYRDAARTQRWGNTLNSTTVSGTGQGDSNPTTSTVYGRVPVQSNVPSGLYTDTVIVTLTY
ncbi:Csu type fimbrial protein [Variovorax terrae]|uniref:Spore coat U domain-containing protein n=1 Tax=Variovorax terrae TaxID=2923278 RepID=A0A9X1VWD8_9BURK|nr:spore coat protein U domain-containing protein [Variovorax terrae]MCJ0763289.1 spore coat U domain-containing protein [Variovorax terrae]